MSTAAWVWVAVKALAALLTIVGLSCLLAAISDSLVASRPISHEADGCRCGGGRR